MLPGNWMLWNGGLTRSIHEEQRRRRHPGWDDIRESENKRAQYIVPLHIHARAICNEAGQEFVAADGLRRP